MVQNERSLKLPTLGVIRELERFKEQDGIPWIEVPPAQLKKFYRQGNRK